MHHAGLTVGKAISTPIPRRIGLIFKAIIIGLLLFVIFSMGQALTYLIRDEGKSDRMVNALTRRIGVSVLIFILLLIGQALGLITPHGIG
jgi:hypothetical protein